MRVDLHIHSTASDGRWTPDQLVQQVRQTGIDLFAVADHDSMANVSAVEQLVRHNTDGLCFIRAAEVSTTLDGNLIHIVAYGVDPENADLQQILEENEQTLSSVDYQSIQKLIEANYPVSLAEYERYENDVTRGGWKALNYMIDKGICHGVKDFFGRLFVGDMALVYPTFADPAEAVRTIHRAGGIAIWAHPGESIRKAEADVLHWALDLGLDGLECYSPYHDRAMIERCLHFCRHHDLLITAGSDCHGGFAGRKLGMPQAYIDDLNLGPLLERVICGY